MRTRPHCALPPGPAPARRIRRAAGACWLVLTSASGAAVNLPVPPVAAHPDLSRSAATPAALAAVPRAGAFCPVAKAGKVERGAKGEQLRCDVAPGDPRYRWRAVK